MGRTCGLFLFMIVLNPHMAVANFSILKLAQGSLSDIWTATLRDAKMVIFDPITAYLGLAKENSNAEVRAALAPINEIAQKRKITVIGVTRLNKKMNMNVVDRILGSSAFKNVARTVGR